MSRILFSNARKDDLPMADILSEAYLPRHQPSESLNFIPRIAFMAHYRGANLPLVKSV